MPYPLRKEKKLRELEVEGVDFLQADVTDQERGFTRSEAGPGACTPLGRKSTKVF